MPEAFCMQSNTFCSVFQASRIIAKLACWSKDLMEGPDLTYYLTWLKDQMKIPVSYSILLKQGMHPHIVLVFSGVMSQILTWVVAIVKSLMIIGEHQV